MNNSGRDLIQEDETIEDLGRCGYRLIQTKDGFRFGEDTVLLAHFAATMIRRRKGMSYVLELGAGCGAASILLSARRPDVRIDGIELPGRAADIFARNIRLNHLEDKVRCFAGDLRQAEKEYPAEIRGGSYHSVFCNPPFFVLGSGPSYTNASVLSGRAAARSEQNGTMDDFIAAAGRFLVPKGDLILVQRAGRLTDVIESMMRARIAPRYIRFVHPKRESSAKLVLVSGQKHASSGGLRIVPPLILYEDSQRTEELLRIYLEEDGSCYIS